MGSSLDELVESSTESASESSTACITRPTFAVHQTSAGHHAATTYATSSAQRMSSTHFSSALHPASSTYSTSSANHVSSTQFSSATQGTDASISIAACISSNKYLGAGVELVNTNGSREEFCIQSPASGINTASINLNVSSSTINRDQEATQFLLPSFRMGKLKGLKFKKSVSLLLLPPGGSGWIICVG